MSRLNDLTGMRFGQLLVLERAEDYIQPNGRRRVQYKCLCDCGCVKNIMGDSLKAGRSRSCGCGVIEANRKRQTKHGMRHTRLYNVWCSMRGRCNNPNDAAYKDYGARGIKVCDEWNKDFMAFYDWAMSNGYNPNAPKGECTLDRRNNNLGYSPENCRWITMKEQCNNRRSNRNLTYNGETHNITEWADIYGINAATLKGRLWANGYDIKEALEHFTN